MVIGKYFKTAIKRFICLHEYKEISPQLCKCEKCGSEIFFEW